MTAARRSVAVAALVLGSALALHCGGDAPRRPSVLVVVLDTVRADRCSLLGHPRPTTPHLDDLARDAVTYEDAWSPASWTAPAHAALFTGRNPHHLDLFRGPDTNLAGDATIAERLGERGWECAAFSANPWVGPQHGLTRGFGTVRHFLPDASGYTDSAVVADAAIAWLRAADASRPFFVFANFMDAHAPYDPPDAQCRAFVPSGAPPGLVAAGRGLRPLEDLFPASLSGTPLALELDAIVRDLYDACVATADEQAGRLVREVRRLGAADDTLIVVASDHGEGLGDHGWREHGLRLHRELLRVPLVVRLPGRFDGGRRVRSPVQLADVATTIYGVCGLDPGPGRDGRDLTTAESAPRPVFATDRPWAGWPMLQGDEMPPGWRMQLETVRRSVYDGRHHLIADDRGGVLLYDTVADPSELRNLAHETPDVVERLRGLLRAEFGDR